MQTRWIILAVLTFARTVMGFQFQSVGAVSPFIIRDLGISYAALGTLIGLYLFPGVAVALPGGVLAQRFGDKRLVCLGLLAMAFGGVLVGLSTSYPVLAAGRVISGCGAVLLNVLLTKMATDWFEGCETVTALGILITSWPLGIAVALIVCPRLAAFTSWQTVALVTAVLSVAAFLIVMATYKEAPSKREQQPLRVTLFLRREELALSVFSGLVWTFYNLGLIIVLTFAPSYFISTGRETAAANGLVSIISWVIIPAIPLGAWVADQIKRPDLIMVFCFLAAAAGILLLPRIGASVVLLAAIGIIFGPPGGLIMALPGQATAPERRGTAMGIYFTCYYLGMGVIPPIAGYVRDLTGNSAAPLWVATAMMVMASACLAAFRYTQAPRSALV